MNYQEAHIPSDVASILTLVSWSSPPPFKESIVISLATIMATLVDILHAAGHSAS